MGTIERLQLKSSSSFNDKVRMPSIKSISKLLTDYGIEHEVSNSVNIVEYRSKGRRYVNSRHRGKEGKKLEIPELNRNMDTSDSYYSCNSWLYAREILQLLEKKGNINNNKK